MNNIELLLSAISNCKIKDDNYPDPFIIEENIVRSISIVNLRLRGDKRIKLLSPQVSDILLRKTSEFIRLMGETFSIMDDDINFDDFIEDSIKISFRKRENMILNIYPNNDIEETYLSYTQGEDNMLIYNSLSAMVPFVKQLLSNEV